MRIAGSQAASIVLDGEKIRSLRLERGVSQAEFAARAGISKSYVSMIENNSLAAISPRAAKRIAAALEMAIGDLMRVDDSLSLLPASDVRNMALAIAGELYREFSREVRPLIAGIRASLDKVEQRLDAVELNQKVSTWSSPPPPVPVSCAPTPATSEAHISPEFDAHERDIRSWALLNMNEHLNAVSALALREPFDPLRPAEQGAGVTPLTLYPPLSPDFLKAIQKADDAPGERYLILAGLSEVTVPLTIHKVRAQPLISRGGSIAAYTERLLHFRKRRIATFEKQLKDVTIRDICPRSAIERYVRRGDYSIDDDLNRLGAEPLTVGQRIEHLRHVIDLLRSEKNYWLGLIDDAYAPIYRTAWLVKQNHSVLIETWRPSTEHGEPVPVNVGVSEPTLVETYRQAFMWLWDRIAEADRKRETIQFLEAQLGILNQRIAQTT